MEYRKIRDVFLNFFKEKDHKIIGEASLIPENDPTLLLTNAGMVPLKPYFLGLEKPPYLRLVNNQRCFRAVDIENVGSNTRTLTFFFMLGSWSIGDYFKEEAISLAWELITKHFNLDKDRIWVSVFKGDKDIPGDKESYKAWSKYLPKNRIVKLDAKENFWIAGTTGPCGPCTEIYYDLGKNRGCGKKSCKPGCDCDRFLEIWNGGVFMEYSKDEEGKISELPLKSVDTGAGLERFAALLQNKESVFETDMFMPIVDKINSLSEKRNVRSVRIIADHIRGSVFLIMDGVVPSNLDRGYVLRRILRRAILHSKLLGINERISEIAEEAIDLYKQDYNQLRDKRQYIIEIINEEDEKFSKSLDKGMKLLQNLIKKSRGKLKNEDVFKLYTSYGFPIELTKEIAEENKLKVDEKAFWKLFKEHQEVSRAGVEKKLGGVGHFGESVARQHTATHLLHQALRDVLGKGINQAGSDLTLERIRFDFNFDRALSEEEIKKVENIVNSKIKQGLNVKVEEMDFDKAKKIAIGLFEEKYKNRVKVYSIGNYSREICAGPHVKNTKNIGKFKIVKQKSIGKGLRRIRAVIS